MATVHKKKEAIILAIDIGKNSSQRDLDGKTHFEKAIFCASMILKRKILTKSEDHLALILFGSSHTINHLSSRETCYGNIEIVAGLDVPTWDLLNRVNSLSPTNVTPSDWISAFVLAADLLKDKTKNAKFTGLQIVMFSNLSTDISFKNINIISGCLKVEDIKLTIVGKDCEVISRHPGSDVFLKTTKATAVNFDLILPKISYYKQKEVINKSWNATLSFEKTFYIKVFGHKKIDITTESSDWLLSKDYDKQDLATAEKKPFEGKGEHNLEVGNESPMDNFNCGDEIIPVIDLNTEDCTYKITGKKCLQVLGFAKITNTQSSFLIGGGSYIFRPHKIDIIAFNAIFDYVVEREEVILVRKIDLYTNLLNIGALFPQKEENEKFFVYVNLPNYVENDDTYKLPPLDAMDVDINGSKFIKPEIKYDVELQSLNDCMVQQISTKIIPEIIQYPIYTFKSIMENVERPLNNFMKSFSFKPEIFQNCPSKDSDNIQFGFDEKLDVTNESMNPSKSFIENAKPSFNEFQNTFSLKQEVLENSPAEDNDTIQFGYDEELDISNKSMNPTKIFIKNAEPSLNEFKNTFSIKQEVFKSDPVENNDAIQFFYDEELDISNKSMKPTKSFIKNAEPSFNEFKNTFSIKPEVFKNGPVENNDAIQFFYDEELDISNKSMNPTKSFIKNAEPSFNEFKNTFSIKPVVFKNGPVENNDAIQFFYDEELDISNKSMNPTKSFIKNAEPSFNEFKNTFSMKPVVFKNGPVENNDAIQFFYDEELDISNKSMNPTKSFIKNAEPSFNEFKNTFSIKPVVFKNGPVENNDAIQFFYDEELDISNKSMKPTKSFIKNAEPSFNEFKNTFSIKPEVFKNGPVENNDAIQFFYDEELDISNKSMNPTKSFIKNAEPSFNEFKNTFSIKPVVFKNGPVENNDAIQFFYDEELDISNKSMKPTKSFIKNAEPSFNEFKNTFSIKQEVFKNGPVENNDAIQFFYDEELDISNKSMNPTKSFIKNAEPSFNEFKNTFSIKQEVFKNGPVENNDAIQFFYDEELDIANKSMNPTKSFIKNAEPSFNEFKNTFSIKQEVFKNSSIEDNDITKVGRDEELEVSKQCVITPLNPIEDMNKLLKNGFDSAIVCKKMQYATLNLIELGTLLEDLMKPIATLKALREYYIINNDAKSYNNFMYLVKDTVRISGKKDMWSKLINSGIGLITNEEIKESDISQESSEEFMKLSGDFDKDFIINDNNPKGKRTKQSKCLGFHNKKLKEYL